MNFSLPEYVWVGWLFVRPGLDAGSSMSAGTGAQTASRLFPSDNILR